MIVPAVRHEIVGPFEESTELSEASRGHGSLR